MPSFDIAIVGYGFSGGMVLANLVQLAGKPMRIAIIDASPHAIRGTAYGTAHREHVLNVRASNMSAFTDDVGGFHAWLKQQGHAYAPTDFAPRMLYGDYLASIQKNAAEIARQKNIDLQHIKADVQHIARDDQGVRITLGSGDALCAAQLVIATGNVFSIAGDDGINRTPWFSDLPALARSGSKRVAIIGTGLTAMDTVISLLDAGYAGEICCISRHGLLPQPHVPAGASYTAPMDALMVGRLSQRMRMLRHMVHEAAAQNSSWHAVIDGLRPHTVSLWQSLGVVDQQRFMTRLFTLWNVHRHRIDPVLFTRITEAANVRVIKASYVRAEADGLIIKHHGAEELLQADTLFDCRGPSYRAMAPFVQQAVRDRLLQAHPISGLIAQHGYRVSDAPIWALGTPLLGEQLETTAVPELRVQAHAVAEALLAN